MTLVAEPHPVATDHTTHHATDDAAGLTADRPGSAHPAGAAFAPPAPPVGRPGDKGGFSPWKRG